MVEYSEEQCKMLTKALCRVFDNEGNEIAYVKSEIILATSKYSSSHIKRPTLFLDGKPLRAQNHDKIRVEYICNCGCHNTILLCKFLNKTRLVCSKCREDEEKVKWHKKFFECKKNGIERGHRNQRSKRQYHFENESESFKEKYFSTNLTQEEFSATKKYIYAIGNYYVYNKDIELLVAHPGNNSKKYRQMIKIDENIIPFKDVYLKCANCGEIFHITRMIKERVNNHNFDCKKCYLSNKSFAVKVINEELNYQGQEEFRFIQRCRNNQLKIVNGPVIPYNFNGKNHYYLVDFQLPELGLLIEIKDNHIWHKQQVISGKWECKETAAINYANKNNMQYKLLFPEDIESFFKDIERDSLDNTERC